MNILGILTLVLTIALAGLLGWALTTWTHKNPLPTSFFTAMNTIHVLWLIAIAVGLATGPLRFVVEYLIIYVGLGIVYTRGLLKGGLMWRILTDPPNVPWGMVLGNAWSAAAALGAFARSIRPF